MTEREQAIHIAQKIIESGAVGDTAILARQFIVALDGDRRLVSLAEFNALRAKALGV